MLTEQTPSTLGSFTLPTLASTGFVCCFSLGKLESRNLQTVCNCSFKAFLLRGSWWDYIGIGMAGVLESSALACFIACSKLSQPHPSVLKGVGFGKLTFNLFAWNDKSMCCYFCLFHRSQTEGNTGSERQTICPKGGNGMNLSLLPFLRRTRRFPSGPLPSSPSLPAVCAHINPTASSSPTLLLCHPI